MTYDLTYGDLCDRLIVYGIDSVEPCEPESNVDFVHFVLDNLELLLLTSLHYSHPLPIFYSTIFVFSTFIQTRSNSLITRVRAMCGNNRAGLLRVRSIWGWTYFPSPTTAKPPTLAKVSSVDVSPLPRRLRRQYPVPINFQTGTFRIDCRHHVHSLFTCCRPNRVANRRLLQPEFPKIRIM